MFRSATTRIAHNAHVPVLAQAAISKDLKALQELINAEKAVQQTLQRLGGDLTKAAEAAKVWASGEGDDLGDTLTACTALLLHFANALNRFSTHTGTVREQMKQVRTREENLDELKKRRKSLVSKADSADKKLSKMSGEHKNFQSQADSLNKLREEIRAMDTEILEEEASLADLKRSNARSWMGTKLGALAECCEKGLIVSDIGKLIVAEIPQMKSEPGLPRPYYTGHANTEALVAEGRRRIESVTFSTDPSVGVRQPSGSELPPIPGRVSRSSSVQFAYGNVPSVPSTPDPTLRNSNGTHFSQVFMSPAGTSYIGLPEVGSSTPGLGMTALLESGGSPYQLPRSPPPGSVVTAADPYDPYAAVTKQTQYTGYTPTTMDEFGVPPSPAYAPRTSSLRNFNDGSPAPSPMGPRGARFATFPTKNAITGPRPQSEASSSSFVPAPPRLDARVPSLEIDREADTSFSSSVAEALGDEWPERDKHTTATGAQPGSKAYESKMYATNHDYPFPPPQYTAVSDVTLGAIVEQPTGTAGRGEQRDVQVPGEPQTNQGAVAENPFGDNEPSVAEGAEESALAYMSPLSENRASLPLSSDHSHEGRRVRFESSDVSADAESPNVAMPEPTTAGEIRAQSPPARADVTLAQNATIPARSPPRSPVVSFTAATPEIPQTTSSPPLPTSPEEEEKALNAAAAREVSRELDALMFNSPLKTSDPPRSAPKPDPLEVPDRPFVRRHTPRRSSVGGDSITPPTSLRNEPSWTRERDRSIVASSPTSAAPHSPTASSLHDHSADGHSDAPAPAPAQPPPPPPITVPPASSSPAPSSTMSTPFRTPLSEYPPPPKGGSFYNLPGASTSGSVAPGGVRTISAAAFKRQLRSPSSPPSQDTALSGGTSPLNVYKRALGSPQPPPRVPGYAGSPTTEPRSRSVSVTSGARQQGGGHQEEDSYDYISAYMDDVHADAGEGHGHE
ncbi:uncharacterized protein PHACADRAFT_175747 [Phanerochaete carnosa HHB-10118-sp]|uniref:Uncharacterized protein n=1 Tax=Phanerochaete carnosa (strain HHB-10118-sp) TaxID=650164 RepID=K5W2L9_PHACS|nr:uncharacterized protein PHACADRAFT_175747 [Phanerochaete carnosa HHB-10118-sp]EKM53340.1 hypothetical protein PHACADRAFT_175747 [Phanerochaete carnosa HHB-10118-sp]